MKAKKILALALCAVMLVCISVGATVAYLTSQTEVINNTFTVGNIKIKLDEAAIKGYNAETNSYDADDSLPRVTENSYKMTPGIYMAKDPTVTVLKDSDRSYIRAFVTIKYQTAAESILPTNVFTTWVQGYDADKWVFEGIETTKTGEDTEVTTDDFTTRVYELRYHNVVDTLNGQDKALEDIFTGIKLPTTLTNDNMAVLGGLTIDVIAQAIQADGFTTDDAAWAAWGN